MQIFILNNSTENTVACSCSWTFPFLHLSVSKCWSTKDLLWQWETYNDAGCDKYRLITSNPLWISWLWMVLDSTRHSVSASWSSINVLRQSLILTFYRNITFHTNTTSRSITRSPTSRARTDTQTTTGNASLCPLLMLKKLFGRSVVTEALVLDYVVKFIY